MIEHVYMRYGGGCMMLMERRGDSVGFVGTAFIVHPDGYLLTTAHILPENARLVVSPRDLGDAFAPTELESVSSHPVRVIRVDETNDVALLALEGDIGVGMPDHVVGEPESIAPGTAVACMGYPFGFHHVYNQCVLPGVVVTKISSARGVDLFVLNTFADEGLRGGPVVDASDGRVIGVLGGRFHPGQLSRTGSDLPSPPGLSYALSITYGAALLEAEGAQVV